jgi:peptide/nickel transport system permease protein
MLSMLMVGARTSIAVALVAVGIGMGLGVPLGLAAAANRGAAGSTRSSCAATT